MQESNLKQVFGTPKCMKKDFRFTYCPGCDHGVATRLVAELIDEFDLREKTISSTCVGCSVFLYNFIDIDCIEAPHGRACASATGVKRAQPDKFVFTYQGDGDFASIGLAESMHTALRGENITSICINNTTYGMTGGQGGPTTLLGQVTTTTPQGRKVEVSGFPLKVSEILKEVDGTAFVARVTLDTPQAIMNAKRCIKKAFEAQLKGLGAGFVEILSSCPTNWKMTPTEAHERVRNEMIPVFPLGVFKDITAENK